MRRSIAAAILTLGLAFGSAAPAWAADPIAGRWVTPERDSVIAIAPCGSSMCGRIAKYLKVPEGGADQRDVYNPDRSKRSRKVLGLNVLSGLKEDGDLWRGTIYDPRSGKSYRSVVRRLSDGRLQVKGCLGPFCQTQVWSRAR